MCDLKISFGTPLVVIHQQVVWQFAEITFKVGNFTFKGVSVVGQSPTGQAVSQRSTADMQVGSMAVVSVEWKDASGGTVKVDGPTTWTSTDESVVQVTVSSGNPQIANAYAPGPIGSASIHATADADLGEGVRKVTAIIDITTISGEAVAGDITFTPTGTHPPSPGGPGTQRGANPPRR